MKLQMIKGYITELSNQIFCNEIVAENKDHLKKLITKEIKLKGNRCNLNHINVSNITDMSSLFEHSQFDGDISKWDVSKVKFMNLMFESSSFNGDISMWNVSNVENMSFLFSSSKFNGDISKWNVSNVNNMKYMFDKSKFNNDLSNWQPYKSDNIYNAFKNCPAPIPYWAEYEEQEERIRAINSYQLNNKLNEDLNINNSSSKKIKI